jgi:hypothetical protein
VINATTPSSPLLPISSRALRQSRSSQTSSLDSGSDSELQQGKLSNPKRRRGKASGSALQKRVRVSQKNPRHGMVEGAMIGNKVFGELSIICDSIHVCTQRFADVPRNQPLRQPEEDKSKANQRFGHQIKDIISRVSPCHARFSLPRE